MNFDYAIPALIGGALIGLAASGLLVLTGKTAGISGIVDGVLRRERNESLWKGAFLAGLILGGAILAFILPENMAVTGVRALPLIAVSGLLVGVGTRMGGGCTSGHGVCGIGRLNLRSLVGTLAFIATGALTVLVANLIAGAS